MKFSRTDIHDVFIIEPQLLGDERGYFSETFKEKELSDFLGHPIHFCQDNESKSSFGVLRGLHFQLPPFAQSKLVRVIQGSVLDVAVDIRKNSPTFGKHVSIELNDQNKKQLFIPRGFAHGFVVLSEYATFSYKVDNYYSPESDRGIAFDDPELNIDWKLSIEELQLSEKDKKQPAFSNAIYFENKENLYA
jgi:dTDP-4-dehydrorhamnose 3,5-epimerase